MDLLTDLLEGHVSFLPVWHLELIEEGEDLLDLLVILLDVVTGNPEVTLHLVQHLVPHLVELNRLVDDETDVWQFLVFLLAAQSDLGWDPMHSLDHFYHILEGAFHVLP